MLQRIFKTKGAKMRWIVRLLALGLGICIAQLGVVPPADAGNRNKAANKMERKKQKKENRFEKRRKDRRIVMFSNWVDENGRKAYLKEMKAKKIKLVKEMPFINGAVLRVPRIISNDELAEDERVVSAVNNHKTHIRKGRKAERLRLRDADSGAELVYISGDGISGDGGSGDGGSGDGGSGDGGSGDGGSGDGGSTVNSMFRLVDPLDDDEKPWGVMDLWSHPYDPEWLTWKMDANQVPYLVKKALNYSHKVNVAILDTGVNYEHPDLENSIAGGVDMVAMESGIPMDNHGHGTHVAGTLVSEHAGVIASKANIYAVRILNDDGSGEVATLLMGMEWAIENQMDIISMSVSYREDNPAVRQAVRMAYYYGITMVAAGGNHSNWEDDDTSSGDGGSGDGGSGDPVGYDPSTGWYPVMYPAAYPEVIAVGAMNTWEQEADFSNSGPEIDVLAPGVDVISTVGAGSYALCNGSSMAAPHVTAAVVLIDSLGKKYGVYLTPADMKYVLNYTAYNGVIDIEAALNMIDYYFGDYYYYY